MIRRTGAGIALGAALLTAACGGPDRVKPGAWAKDICGTVRPWAEHIQQSVTDAQATLGKTSDPAVTKPKLSQLFGDAANETDKAIKGVDRAGVPDVDNGEQIAKQFRAALVNARDAFARARRSIDGLSTNDKAKFNADVVRIGNQLSTDYAKTGKAIGNTNSAELRKAFDSEPECTRAP